MTPPTQSEPPATKTSRSEVSRWSRCQRTSPVGAARTVANSPSAQTTLSCQASRSGEDGFDHCSFPVRRSTHTSCFPFWNRTRSASAQRLRDNNEETSWPVFSQSNFPESACRASRRRPPFLSVARRRLTSGSAVSTGGNYVLHSQIGHGSETRAISGGNYTLRSNVSVLSR